MTPENLTRLRELASAARIEWRVADPATKDYCMSYDRSDTLTPEEDAHAWLDDQRKRVPGGRFADYEVICVEVRTELQRLAAELLTKADRLNTPGDPDLLAQLHAQCKHLLDDLTVTTHDEHGLAEHSPVANLTYSNFIGALAPLVSRAGAALAAPKDIAKRANAIWDPNSPVEPNALESSIAALDAWDARADGEPLTQDESESVALVLHELKRLRAARHSVIVTSSPAWPKARDVGRLGDMSPSAHLRVGLDSDNDVYVSVWDEKGGASIEFCTPGSGGGKSSRTRMALIALMVAMEADNADTPSLDWWALRINGSQATKGGA